MSFYDCAKKQLDKKKTFTTNGAVAYATSGKELLDFNFSITKMREAKNSIEKEFEKVFLNESPETAMRYLFYVGDCRNGLGERNVFRNCLSYLAKKQPEYANAIIKLIPEYSRWDIVVDLLNHNSTKKNAVTLIRSQLRNDLENMRDGKSISLCAKWMPSVNASSNETKEKAVKLCKMLNWSQRKYRKVLSSLRAYLDVVEVKMSKKEWGSIEYSSVPSKANLKYNSAFLRNDEERRRKFLGDLQNGKTKINAGVLTPDEIVRKYTKWYLRVNDLDETLEQLWKSLSCVSTANNLVIRDGSGSMTCCNFRPLMVSTALAIYMADHNSGGWKDKFITFSSEPEIVDLSHCKTLKSKLENTFAHEDCSNTDIYKTMMLILNTAVEEKMSQSEMPELITIISDMQFDGARFNLNESLFDKIKEEYEEHGYHLPRICFWNVAVNGIGGNTVPMQSNDYGLILCSGYSQQIMKMFMSNHIDPYEVLIEEIYNERYDAVAEAISNI